MEYKEFRFVFHAKDFARSVHFYQHVLGMAPVGGWDREDGKGALLSAGGIAVVEIFGAAQGQLNTTPAPSAVSLSLCLESAALLDETYARLVSTGASLGPSPQDHYWGHRSFTVYDPDGIPIHLYAVIG